MDANEIRAAFPHLSQTCWCGSCDSLAAQGLPEGDWRRLMRRMNLCPDCGNKRCPRATHHDNACTASNEPGQQGSVYVGIDSQLAKQMGLCKGGDGFWCGALINNGADHKPGCPQAVAS